MLPIAVMLASCLIVTRKTALKAGSSKHGNAFLASTKQVSEASSHLKEPTHCLARQRPETAERENILQDLIRLLASVYELR